jgi:hypothetical protein
MIPVHHSLERVAYATGKVGVAFESHSYNKSHSGPKAHDFSEIVDQRSFLVLQIPPWPS